MKGIIVSHTVAVPPEIGREHPSRFEPPVAKTSIAGSVREILGDLVDYRDLLFQLTLRDIRIRYKQAAMGFGWAIFMPMLIVMAGMLVRFAMAHMSGTTLAVREIGGLAVKALPWAFFVGTIQFATVSLTANMNLVSKVYFPREVLPLSSTLAQGFDSSIGSIALVFALPFLGAQMSWALLWVPLVVLLLVLLTSGVSLFLSCANLFFRDVKYIVQVLLTFGIFFTPVFFEPAMLGPLGAKVAMINPLAPILEGLRLAIIDGHNLMVPLHQTTKAGLDVLAWTPWYLAWSAAWATLGLLGSMLLFHRAEFVFAEYV